MKLAAIPPSSRPLDKAIIPTLATVLMSVIASLSTFPGSETSLSHTPVESSTLYPNGLSNSGSIKPNMPLACTMPCLLRYLVPTSGGCCVRTLTSLMVLSATSCCSHKYLTATCLAFPRPILLRIYYPSRLLMMRQAQVVCESPHL
eukprot:6465804-Amphidinium_carterae.1